MAELLPADLFAFFLVFARLGGALMMLPGFGETYVSPRARLALAAATTVAVTPAVADTLPPLPASLATLVILLFGEIVIGVFLGTVARMIMSALHVAGTVFSFQSGLANAMTFDPVSASQASVMSLFLSVAGIVVVFASDLHHVMLRAMVASYGAMTPGIMPLTGDMAQSMARLVADSFLLGIQLATPFIAVGLVFYLGIGLLARLMPQVQIFFVAMPVMIFLGFATMALSVMLILMWFGDSWLVLFESALGAE